MKLLAITSCPNGIAHTYMAAENLQKAAAKLGIEMKVETQGSIGVENEFSERDIEEADGIIIAADKAVVKDRFAGKRMLVAGVQDGIRRPEALIQEFQEGKVTVYKPEERSIDEIKREKKKKENPIYRHLMNGVSYMIPFIVIGGLLIAIALTLGGETTPGGIVIPEDSFWKKIELLGGASFTFMVPILAGFIAVSIADRPGLAPGVIGGYIAANGSFYDSEAGAGFIGGIIAGFLAGYVALMIKRVKVPKALLPIMPIIIIPIFASLIVGLIFVYVIGAPIAALFIGLTEWLAGMQGSSSILLALILGAMISFDMGGPVNKVAFLFGSAMIAEGNYEIMGPIAVAICVPPIGMGLATMLKKRKYQPAEQEAGKAAMTMGVFGITEGAIPFAAQDPLRVIPSIMAGSMTGAVIAMIGNVGDRVAHGGPIVALLGAVNNVLMFFIAIICGVIVTALLVNLLKRDVQADDEADVKIGENVNEDQYDQNKVQKLTNIMNEEMMILQLDGDARDDVIDELIEKLDQSGALESKSKFREAIIARENESTTGIGENIAIPHGKSSAVRKPAVAFGIKQQGVNWGSMDGTDAKLIFMIAVPEQHAGDAHLKILQMLSRKLMDESFREQLLAAKTKQEAYDLLNTVQ
ncbi:PTS mannose transporter subunit IIABC [Jeotgalibacillus proteolyticus]|uniref:PTS mannose transporter subunit IIABC n=1 Tax=Jeotgalibacillus proteolyticus TaxID=2082395 RepID=A0A2S5G864_9BACL|nr:PTS fructose transporter subunit IIABC [Jeotgalibacillus proteolyticus]PPA69182.1 PTS mannose transporter subunit IIABC [Jeotgalibacillus proteolyticus]